MRRTTFAIAAVSMLAFAGLAASALYTPASTAADHLDAPDLTSPGGDGRVDINDLFVFQAPNMPNKTVLAMTVSPAVGVFSPDSFNPEARYIFNIDNTGNAVQNDTWRVSFSPVRENGTQIYRVRGPFDVVIEGRVGVAASGGGVRAFAGQTDDPFFFDLNAFLGSDGRTFCDGGENDFFAGLDVLTIVLLVPNEMLTADGGTTFNTWAATRIGEEQIDRMGIPALNTVFIPRARKNTYNTSLPVNDPDQFGRHFGDLAGVLLPDVLPFDTSMASGFLNGRQLSDDVIDIELQVITGDPGAGDCVDANDRVFSDAFPYFAQANTAAQAFSYDTSEN